MTAPYGKKYFLPAAAVLLLVMAVTEVASMLSENQTCDETYHLLYGYNYLKSGGLPTDSEHPPLSQIASAWPLLFLDLHLPENHPDQPDNERRREREFLYHNRYPAETLLLLARLAHLLITLAMAAVISYWTSHHFGPAAGLAALWLFAFDPNFLAHGKYVTTDVPAAFCFLLACLAWNRFLNDGRFRSLAWCGIATGIAMATKYSTVLLFAMYGLLYLIRWWQQSGRMSLWRLVKSMAVVAVIMFLFVYAVFGFETRALLSSEITATPEPLSVKLRKNPSAAANLILGHPFLARVADRVALAPVPAPSFLRGLVMVQKHVAKGHGTYLLGQTSETGWWYYFPVIVGTKTPIGDLLLFLLAVGVSVLSLFRAGPGAVLEKLRSLRMEWWVLVIPPLIYFAAAVSSHINLGVRHLLPVYPFVLIWMAAVMFGPVVAARRLRVLAMVCLGLVAIESALAFPHYIAFFNAPSLRAGHDARIALDSNLDWGQDLKQVRPYLSAHHVTNVCLGYFGEAPLDHFGMDVPPVPSTLADAKAAGCVVVISVTLLYEGNLNGRFDWLLQLQPVDFIGNSFRVYDPNHALGLPER